MTSNLKYGPWQPHHEARNQNYRAIVVRRARVHSVPVSSWPRYCFVFVLVLKDDIKGRLLIEITRLLEHV